MSDVYLIGGPNGSGKTTVAKKLLPNFLGVIEYVNADEIAAGLSPFNPESVAIQAGRLMLERLITLKCQGIDFAFESTLAARYFDRFLRDCQSSGYRLNLIYFWLQSPELALERVHRRVASGGHNIPEDVVLIIFLKMWFFVVMSGGVLTSCSCIYLCAILGLSMIILGMSHT